MVNELEATTALRQDYVTPTSLYDYTNDTAYFTFVGNISLKYPGTTLAAIASSGGTLIASVLDTAVDPPPIAFVQQDASTGFNYAAWLLAGFNQTLSTRQLYDDIAILSSSNKFIDSLSLSRNCGRHALSHSDRSRLPTSPWSPGTSLPRHRSATTHRQRLYLVVLAGRMAVPVLGGPRQYS